MARISEAGTARLSALVAELEARVAEDGAEDDWKSLQALVESLEDSLDREPPAPAPAAVAEAEAIERTATRLAEFERSGKFRALARNPLSPGQAATGRGSAGSRLLGSVATGILVAAVTGGHGVLHLWQALDQEKDEKERRALAKRRRKIQSKVAASRERKEVGAIVAGIEGALPPSGGAVERVRAAFRAFSEDPDGSEAVDTALSALAVRLGVLRREHLVARARALLAPERGAS